jgi:hypothetical protein
VRVGLGLHCLEQPPPCLHPVAAARLASRQCVLQPALAGGQLLANQALPQVRTVLLELFQ